MVDCLAAMAEQEATHLAGKKVLIIGTAFTVNRGLYAEILDRAVPGVRVAAVAATELERKIARFEHWDGSGDASLTVALRQALENTDVAILACTCFPMVQADLQAMYPDVVFLDPGAWCPGLVTDDVQTEDKMLSLEVTGNAVSEERVVEFARSYLGEGSIDSLGSQ
jgi:glutamate racemase